MKKEISLKYPKKNLFLITGLIIFILLLGFTLTKKKDSMNVTSQAQQSLETTYSGTFPCADCSGIQTVLTFKRQAPSMDKGTYTLSEIYEGKSVTPFITKGTWITSKGTPKNPDTTVYILSLTDSTGKSNYLQVNDNEIKQLDSNLTEIDSPFNLSLKKQTAGLANPASVNCSQKGGTSAIMKRGDGGEFGICMFEDNMACEEWALLRGECPVGGVKTTGYDTVEQKYCAWLGGETVAKPNAVCTFLSGTTCSNADLYNGKCLVK